jgi:hypothetical protein
LTRARVLLVVLVALVVPIPACRGSGGDGGGAATTNGEPSPSTTARGRDDTTASEQITALFIAFFDGGNPDIESKLQLLENPEQVRAIYVASVTGVNEEKARRTSVRVTAIEFTSDLTADVTYDVLVDATDPPALADFAGSAVRLAGAWKITTRAFCDFAFLGLPQPEECRA